MDDIGLFSRQKIAKNTIIGIMSGVITKEYKGKMFINYLT